jgi:hypothetical protein
MDNREGWDEDYCEQIENELDSSEIEFDEVEVVENTFATYLKIDGVDVSGEGESEKDTTFYGLPDDPGEAADKIIEHFTGEQENE